MVGIYCIHCGLHTYILLSIVFFCRWPIEYNYILSFLSVYLSLTRFVSVSPSLCCCFFFLSAYLSLTHFVSLSWTSLTALRRRQHGRLAPSLATTDCSFGGESEKKARVTWDSYRIKNGNVLLKATSIGWVARRSRRADGWKWVFESWSLSWSSPWSQN